MSIKVQNLNGSGKNTPSPACTCDSWIDHWNKNRYPDKSKVAGWCRSCREKVGRDNLIGGHVFKRNSTDEKRYITPICYSCNNTKNKQFDVKLVDLVSANCSKCTNK